MLLLEGRPIWQVALIAAGWLFFAIGIATLSLLLLSAVARFVHREMRR